MDVVYDVFDEKIRRAKDSIEFLKNRIESLSEGARQMYLMERQADLQLLMSGMKTFSSEEKNKLSNYNFSKLIDDIYKDLESFEEKK